MVSFAPASAVNHYSFSSQNSLGGFGIAGHLAPFLVAAFQSGRVLFLRGVEPWHSQPESQNPQWRIYRSIADLTATTRVKALNQLIHL